MKQYLDLLKKIRETGDMRDDRTGTGTIGLFGQQMRFDLKEGFPLLTTKKMFTAGIVHELLWFLSGDNNIKYLTDNNVHIWDAWADSTGNVGRSYGKQWRDWTQGARGIDQIAQVIADIKCDPFSRRHIVTTWNPAEAHLTKLPPCHVMFQFHVDSANRLSCCLTQRSADMFLGLPFNIASYALLTHMIAQVCDLQVGEFIWNGGDCHIYLNHLEQVDEQLSRFPMELCKLSLSKKSSIDAYSFEDITFLGYLSHPAIKAEVSV